MSIDAMTDAAIARKIAEEESAEEEEPETKYFSISWTDEDYEAVIDKSDNLSSEELLGVLIVQCQILQKHLVVEWEQ